MEHPLKACRGFAATTILAVVATMVAGVWLATSVLVQLDRFAGGQSPSRLVISELSEAVTKADALDVLADEARNYKVNLALLVPDLGGNERVWHQFVFEGDPLDKSLEAAPFDPEMTIRTHSSSKIEREDVRGIYAVTADGETLDALANDLNARGLKTSAERLALPVALGSAAFEPGTSLVLLVVVLGTVLAVLSEADARRRRQAVRRFVGWSRCKSLARESLEMMLLIATTIALLTAVGTGALWIYNSLQGVRRLMPLIGLTWGAAIVVVTTLFLLASSRPGLARAAGVFAGHAPPLRRRVIPVACCVVLVSSTVWGLVGVATTLESTQLLEQTLARRAPLADTVRIAVGVATVSNKDFDTGFGKIVRSELSARRALIAGHDDAPNYPNGPFGPNHLLVNRAYLEKEPVRDTRAQPLKLPPSSPKSFDILIPASLEVERERIVKEFEEWLDFQEEFTGAIRPSTVRVQLIADGQDTPDFGDGYIPGDVHTRTGNVIAVVSDDASAVADEMLSSYAGNGQMLFTDPALLRSAIDKGGFAGAVSAIDRYGDTIIRQLAEVRAEIARLLTASLMALVVLILATWSSVAQHGVRRQVERRVLTLTGRSRWAAHARYLVTSVALSAGVASLAAALVGATVTAFAVGAVCVALDSTVRFAGMHILDRQDRRLLRSRVTVTRLGCRAPVKEHTA